jgi:ubiquinone/menaquinone biosynthesis C-methylase UbiE
MASRSSNRRRNHWVVSLLQIEPDDRVLEIGFGPGIAVQALARLATEGVVCGLDHSEEMLRQATRRNAAAIQAGRVDLRLGSVEHLPSFGEPFAKILAVNTMGFWNQPLRRLEELRRLLRPGGRIAIAHQPRDPGATDATTASRADGIATVLTRAGFTDVRVHTLSLGPAVACVLGVNPDERA